jgi:ZIP Zinc transporter
VCFCSTLSVWVAVLVRHCDLCAGDAGRHWHRGGAVGLDNIQWRSCSQRTSIRCSDAGFCRSAHTVACHNEVCAMLLQSADDFRTLNAQCARQLRRALSCINSQPFALVLAGTFLYVAMMEVLPRELSNPDHRLLKLSMLTLGFGLMSLLAIWA